MDNYLFICYYFHPIKAVGSIRNSKLAKYISRKNKLFVLSTLNSLLFPKDSLLKDTKTFKLFRMPTFDYQTIKLLLLKINNLLKKNIVYFNPHKNISQKSFLKVVGLFPFNVLFGEGGFFYIVFNMLWGFYLIKRFNITRVYTSFSPFSDIVTGFILKKLFPHLVWVADFRDLPDTKNHGILSFLNERLYRLVLRHADGLSAVSKGLAKTLRTYRKNIHVLRNGFDPDEGETGRLRVDSFSFLYVGALYGSRRDPGLLMQALKELVDKKQVDPKHVSFQYAGKEGRLFLDKAEEYGISSFCSDLKFLSRNRSLIRQKRSYFLVMLTWSSKDQKGIISGKFYEYLSARRPVICLINGSRDKEIEDIFKRTKAGIVVYHKDQKSLGELKRFILTHYANFKKKRTAYDYNAAEVQKYSYDNLAEELALIFRREGKQCAV
ncbi:MAG: hypothetical protein JW827_09655 [Spirochaetes bacterium]|nr:hypothetical protein [Spirochaetota bacterium]